MRGHRGTSSAGRFARLWFEVLETREMPAGFPLGFGSTGTDGGNAVATDSAGNVYVAGSFQGTVDFDPGAGVTNLISAGADDIFVAKYTPTGILLWAGRMGGAGGDVARGIAVDGAGNVHLTGAYTGTADFDPGPSTANLASVVGSTDIFVAKLDTSGVFVWARSMGGTWSFETGNAIAVDGSGNVLTTGYFGTTSDFDPGPGTFNIDVTDKSPFS